MMVWVGVCVRESRVVVVVSFLIVFITAPK